MATAFAQRTSAMQRAAAPAGTSQRSSASVNVSSFRPRALASLRRVGGAAPAASRSAGITPLAYRGGPQQQWTGFGRGSHRRGACGPMVWQFGSPAAQATLEELAREFGFTMNGGCEPRKGGSKKGGMWADFVNQASLPLDFEERDADYLLTADVPGLQKTDLKITVNKEERSLTVSGERQRASREDGADAEEGQRRRQRLERRMGKFERVVPGLPEDADLSSVAARVEKGVLAVTIKKLPEVEQPDNTINIDID